MATVNYCQEFDTRQEAEDYVSKIKQNYHPAGYGTTLTISPVGDKFEVRGYRFTSCD